MKVAREHEGIDEGAPSHIEADAPVASRPRSPWGPTIRIPARPERLLGRKMRRLSDSECSLYASDARSAVDAFEA